MRVRKGSKTAHGLQLTAHGDRGLRLHAERREPARREPGRSRAVSRRRAPTTLPRSFYARPTLTVARELVGKVLVHRSPRGTTSGKIVEVEAYIGEDDPACHAAPGLTRRNAPLYGEPGHAYVYFNYGTHDMFNVVSEPAGRPAAILVRALEPLDGVDLMEQRRAAWRASRSSAVRPSTRSLRPGSGTPSEVEGSVKRISTADLCRGPGNLARAMGITLADNRRDLCGRNLYIEDRGLEVGQVAWSPRIGINVGVDRLWRYYVVGSLAISGRKRPASAPGSRAGRRGSRRTTGSARGSA